MPFKNEIVELSTGEKVEVKEFKIVDYNRYADVALNEFAIVSASTGKSFDWINALSGDDYNALARSTERVQEPFFQYTSRFAEKVGRLPESVIDRIKKSASHNTQQNSQLPMA